MTTKTNIVERIDLKFPELFKEDSDLIIKDKLNSITQKKARLASLHIQYMEMEKEIASLEEEMRGILPLVDIVYKTIEVEDKVHGECNLLITNPTDARNLNYGQA